MRAGVFSGAGPRRVPSRSGGTITDRVRLEPKIDVGLAIAKMPSDAYWLRACAAVRPLVQGRLRYLKVVGEFLGGHQALCHKRQTTETAREVKRCNVHA